MLHFGAWKRKTLYYIVHFHIGRATISQIIQLNMTKVQSQLNEKQHYLTLQHYQTLQKAKQTLRYVEASLKETLLFKGFLRSPQSCSPERQSNVSNFKAAYVNVQIYQFVQWLEIKIWAATVCSPATLARCSCRDRRRLRMRSRSLTSYWVKRKYMFKDSTTTKKDKLLDEKFKTWDTSEKTDTYILLIKLRSKRVMHDWKRKEK